MIKIDCAKKMVIIRVDMAVKYLLVGLMVYGHSGWILGGMAASLERGYRLNSTSAEITVDETEFRDIADQSGPPDSHEAMNNREFKTQQREKRSFEFLVGLVNNNSKYEVIRSDPELTINNGVSKKPENRTTDATALLLDLLAKIVTYPDRWREIHQLLKNLDQDLISSQHILRHHQQLEKQRFDNFNRGSKRKLEEKPMVIRSKWKEQILSTTTNKWPDFDRIEENAVVSAPAEATHKSGEKISEKSAYQKSFAYHKVTVSGKPAHLKKNPTAYIAVSAISPKPSEPEEDFLLETELHQLKPWKNKHSSRKV